MFSQSHRTKKTKCVHYRELSLHFVVRDRDTLRSLLRGFVFFQWGHAIVGFVMSFIWGFLLGFTRFLLLFSHCNIGAGLARRVEIQGSHIGHSFLIGHRDGIR